MFSENIDSLKKGMEILSQQTSKVGEALDSSTKKVLVSCIYSLAKVKTALNIQNDSVIDKALQSVADHSNLVRPGEDDI